MKEVKKGLKEFSDAVNKFADDSLSTAEDLAQEAPWKRIDKNAKAMVKQTLERTKI